MIEIFADGSSTGKVGDGGWGTIIRIPNQQDIELSGGEKETTNNRMELLSAINGLKYVQKHYETLYLSEEIVVVCDSQYVVKGITDWIYSWIQKGFKHKGGVRPNKDLWLRLFKLKRDNIKFKWTRGHDGHVENERCDKLAKQAKAQMSEGTK